MSATEYEAVDLDRPSDVGPILRLVDSYATTPRLRYNGWRRQLKRLFDVTVAGMVLPIALPVMACVAVVVKVTSRGPVFYRQNRVGQYGRTFRVLKFRTMYVDADRRLLDDRELYAAYTANDFKLANNVDPRVTSAGRFLRTSSLDELPQLFNVLSGSMSLVGPRPIVRAELVRYGESLWSYLQLRPGITGRWQVEGRNFVRYPERALLDEEYLHEWRFRRDVVILARTVPSVLRRYGCH